MYYLSAGVPVKAINIFEQMAKIHPEHPGIRYNLACLYSRTGENETAVKWLKSAIDKGYSNKERIKTDPDLAKIRNLPEVMRILEEI